MGEKKQYRPQVRIPRVNMGVDKFYDNLYGSKFEVRTNNSPLTYVLSTAEHDATGHQWLASLTAFDFSIKYHHGKNNIDADALSRRPNSNTQRFRPM